MPKLNKNKKVFLTLVFLLTLFVCKPFLAYSQDSADFVARGWSYLGDRNFERVFEVTGECILKFGDQADQQAKGLTNLVPGGPESPYRVMNNVATCYFIQAEAHMRQDKNEAAIEKFQTVIDKYPYAQTRHWHGWDWSLGEVSQESIVRLKTGKVEEIEDDQEVIITQVTLHDSGQNLPINYQNYGTFEGAGTFDYRYIIEKPVELARAVGAGVYPNTNSIRFDPNYQEIRSQLYQIDHWEILKSRDLSTAFYKWINAPEPEGIRQFHLAEIMERSGLIEQAIKGYYAILVHFPKTYSWTYWGTPWYVGPAALHRIKYLLAKHPELGLTLKDAEIIVIDGFDNSVRNTRFIVNPGRIVRKPFWQRFLGQISGKKSRNLGKIIQSYGESVKLVRYQSGDWQLLVEGEPFMIQAITYDPTRVGESPDEGTLQDWTRQDINNNGIIDAPYQAWLDLNRNNKLDSNEKKVGDFQLMADMGINAIRLYHQPFDRDIKIIRNLHQKYGIYTLMGDFLGKYTLGSGARWEEGTDYTNPQHQENMLESVADMVTKYRDEDAILLWLLGNENVYGFGCNADENPKAFFQFANQAAKLIKKLDPKKRPVAIVSGDTLYLDLFAQYSPDIDIFGTNSYRGKYGFLGLFDDVARVADKPAIITEYGAPAYGRGYTRQEAEKFQAEYHRGCWKDIENNSAGYGAGNSLGGIIFEWVDEWWKSSGDPNRHSRRSLFTGPFLDGHMYEEWLGLMSQGDGSNSPFLRQPRKSYYMYKELWN